MSTPYINSKQMKIDFIGGKFKAWYIFCHLVRKSLVSNLTNCDFCQGVYACTMFKLWSKMCLLASILAINVVGDYVGTFRHIEMTSIHMLQAYKTKKFGTKKLTFQRPKRPIFKEVIKIFGNTREHRTLAQQVLWV